ncbi:MAG: sel1 repeat family protein [Pseudomonadota bacterium]
MSKTLLVCMMFALSSVSVWAKEDCGPEAIGVTEEALAQKYFYTGTCHFRNNDYAEAAQSWTKLANLESVNADDQSLQIDVLNNLGYLLFFGYGVEADQREALNYWHKAVGLGHDESEYHLCHAYGDADEATFDKAKAQTHCDNAFSLYSNMTDMNDDHKTILKQITFYRNQVNEPK